MSKLLVLDLDSTLFYATTPVEDLAVCDFVILDKFPTMERPGVHNFLEYAFSNFVVAVWTSASAEYAKDAVQKLFLDNGHPLPYFTYDVTKCVKHRNVKNECFYGNVQYLKDLKKLKHMNFPLEQILAVDDSPAKFSRHYGNYICIEEFLGSNGDCELFKLTKYLDTIKFEANVRLIEKRGWSNNF